MRTHEIATRAQPARATRGTIDPIGRPPRREGKVQARHLDRLAVVYVRQSSPQQVHEHRESAACSTTSAAAPRPSAGRRTASSSSTRTRAAAAGPPRAGPGSSGSWPRSGSTTSG